MHTQAPIKPEGQTQAIKDAFMDAFILGIDVDQIKMRNVKMLPWVTQKHENKFNQSVYIWGIHGAHVKNS